MQINGTVNLKSTRILRVGALLAVAAALGIFWLAADSAQAGDGSLGRLSAANLPSAEASAVKSLDELMRMRIKKVKGKRVSAKGRSVGTVVGKVSFNLVLTNGSHATARFFGSNAHGTISGTGVASYRVAGPVSYYSGKVTDLSGTGRYAHAATRGIKFSGSVNRKSYKVTMHLRGSWHV
jgi:hypothetical protein